MRYVWHPRTTGRPACPIVKCQHHHKRQLAECSRVSEPTSKHLYLLMHLLMRQNSRDRARWPKARHRSSLSCLAAASARREDAGQAKLRSARRRKRPSCMSSIYGLTSSPCMTASEAVGCFRPSTSLRASRRLALAFERLAKRPARGRAGALATRPLRLRSSLSAISVSAFSKKLDLLPPNHGALQSGRLPCILDCS